MEEQYVELYINEELLEEEKQLLSYPISYHSRIVLSYNNPNILLKMKYNNSVTEIVVDYNKSVLDIVNLFISVIKL